MIVQLGAYDPTKDYSGTYMLAFYFAETFGIPYCHCTHKYLGAVPQETLCQVMSQVDQYFSARKRELAHHQLWWFDRFTHLGPDEVPVLERRNLGGMLLDLKRELDGIVPEKWPSYRPHVTIPKEFEFMRLPMKPVAYKLVEGDKVIREWAMGRGF